MADSVQKNFRMSSRAIKLLRDVARARGMTETEVVETCVSKFALSIGQDVERARELLFEQICKATANSPVNVARVPGAEDQIAAAGLEGRKGHEGRKDVAVEAEATFGHSAAGSLAITAAESAGRKHGPVKKK